MPPQCLENYAPAGRRLAHGIVLLLCIGCGRGPAVAPVSGVITLDGAPLAHASITTQPVATDSANPGSGSFGATDENGHFDLELVTPAAKGAVVGEHRVMIAPMSAEEQASQPQQTAEGIEVWTDNPSSRKATMAANKSWPTKFSDGSLRLQVPPEGNTDVRLELTR